MQIAFFINQFNGCFYAKSARQDYVGLSSTECELIALSEAVKLILCIRRILSYLGFSITAPTLVQQDNTSAIQLIIDPNSGSLDKRKHICPKLFHSRDEVIRGTINLLKVDTNEIAADTLTKILAGSKMVLARDRLLGISNEEATQVSIGDRDKNNGCWCNDPVDKNLVDCTIVYDKNNHH